MSLIASRTIVVTIVVIAPIIAGFIKFTSLNDCRVIINDSDYKTTEDITKLKVIKSINNKSSNNSSNSIDNNRVHKSHLLK